MEGIYKGPLQTLLNQIIVAVVVLRDVGHDSTVQRGGNWKETVGQIGGA